jgi:hypothetical protein
MGLPAFSATREGVRKMLAPTTTPTVRATTSRTERVPGSVFSDEEAVDAGASDERFMVTSRGRWGMAAGPLYNWCQVKL